MRKKKSHVQRNPHKIMLIFLQKLAGQRESGKGHISSVERGKSATWGYSTLYDYDLE